ncbi:MAG: arsenate reductase ArsC [Fimbriimonas ginsengisoli]|uniref:Arsenate reductase ArsC n=1 Tax=Fimbriimonas ginsengisoli TaxID=1005039 RepID=A0A931LU52_FIMGI|nr:arsenate reductase ArsC [Fimbriimonas ginsengisoli]
MLVLFVCVHNTGRSQMAEAFFNRLAREGGMDVRAESAGTLGAGALNPTVVEAMAELGISMKGQKPKALTSEMVRRATKVVSMGCGVDTGACPTRFVLTDDWALADPAGQPIEQVREIRYEIERRVKRLFAEISSGIPT